MVFGIVYFDLFFLFVFDFFELFEGVWAGLVAVKLTISLSKWGSAPQCSTLLRSAPQCSAAHLLREMVSLTATSPAGDRPQDGHQSGWWQSN